MLCGGLGHCLAYLLFLLASCQLANLAALPQIRPQSTEAYVTLLYGDTFLTGVRVLGQSLRQSGTTRNLVVLATRELSLSAEQTLISDGWIVKRVDVVPNPGKGPQRRGYPMRFWAVYTKLQAFNLLEYRKVVYLDADVLVIKNIDTLFACPGFCAVLRHSERLNSGVMVLTPNKATYEDMMAKIQTTPSYTGGDQGFLNSYFTAFPSSELFDEQQHYPESSHQIMRLPTIYNADISLYIVNSNHWSIPEDSIRVIHYTLGPIKPWMWWSQWLIPVTALWQEYRLRLPEFSRGKLGAPWYRRHSLTLAWLGITPLLIMALIAWRCAHPRWRGWQAAAKLLNFQPASLSSASIPLLTIAHPTRESLPPMFVGLSVAAGYSSLVAAVWITLVVIPTEVFPTWGWLFLYEWGFFLLWMLFGKYLHICYRWGRMGAGNTSQQALKMHSKPWSATLATMGCVTLILVVTPWSGNMLEVHGFVGQLLSTVLVSIFDTIVLTSTFVTLPAQWYVCGRFDALVK